MGEVLFDRSLWLSIKIKGGGGVGYGSQSTILTCWIIQIFG